MNDIGSSSYKISNYGNYIKQYPQIKQKKLEAEEQKERKKKKLKKGQKSQKNRKKTKTNAKNLSPIDDSISLINTINKSTINTNITNLQKLDNTETKLSDNKNSTDLIEFPITETKFAKINTNSTLFIKKTVTNNYSTMVKNNSNPNYFRSILKQRGKPSSTDLSASNEYISSFPNITFNSNNNTLTKNNSAVKKIQLSGIFNKNEDSMKEINQIKKIVNCYICSKNVISPRICPKCQKVACEKCLDKYFNEEKNTKCYYCKNEMSYNDFKSFMKDENIPLEKFDKMIKQMEFLVQISFKSVGKKLMKTIPVLCFEIFGYDFILDSDFNPWILEINNNPGLGISSPVIQKLVPRMLDDAFRLTIDKVFDTKYSEDVIDENVNYKSKYQLDGFTDEENVFEFLCNVG